eukprot:767033-Hanusia_phi.AAC.8
MAALPCSRLAIFAAVSSARSLGSSPWQWATWQPCKKSIAGAGVPPPAAESTRYTVLLSFPGTSRRRKVWSGVRCLCARSGHMQLERPRRSPPGLKALRAIR